PGHLLGERKSGGTNGTASASALALLPSSKSPSSATSAMHSLLGEVMEKIGLTDIQQYSEAYRQAKEELVKSVTGSGSGGSVKTERPSSSSSHISENNNSSLNIN